ncbi:MAG: CBS domain-containing protein [Chloroflexi bacterium]|nr:CBS domain-containing protein [Chloroflexota bacterium]
MSTNNIPLELKLNRKDFVSDQTVRWCPGCGDYAILAQVQKVLPTIGVPKENIVFISGIGCSSRFPYYMNTYGIHSIHGRAPTLATGLAITNPDLSVWVVTGDGDGLSIGGNHFIHAIRRNVDLNILLFNNRIYGLTKGQYSPTSPRGKVTKSSPMGSLDNPINPISLALAADASFIARALDVDTKYMGGVFYEASQHDGTSLVEIYQNCVIFNPTEWEGISDRRNRAETLLYLKHGEPMIFGKNMDKGITLDGFTPIVVELGNGFSEDDLLVHDETSSQLAYILSSMSFPEFPVPMGVIHRVARPTYTEGLLQQIKEAQDIKGPGDLYTLYTSADLWTVSEHDEPTADQTGELSQDINEQYVDDLEQDPVETTLIQDLMVENTLAALNPKPPITVDAETSLEKAIRQMNTHNIGCVLVTDDEDRLIGIFTERDVLMRVTGLVDDLAAADVGDYMTADPVALTADLPIAQALHEMSVHGFRHLPLVDSEYHPEGIISFRDVINHMKASFTDN